MAFLFAADRFENHCTQRGRMPDAGPAKSLPPNFLKDDDKAMMLIAKLRSVLLAPPCAVERLHVVFYDKDRALLGDMGLGYGQSGSLSLRLRQLFSKALSVGARAILIAHNNPSGDCRPSQRDIEATSHLCSIAQALEIDLLDHLIFTQSAVYSMRARGRL